MDERNPIEYLLWEFPEMFAVRDRKRIEATIFDESGISPGRFPATEYRLTIPVDILDKEVKECTPEELTRLIECRIMHEIATLREHIRCHVGMCHTDEEIE